jgi:hypothetical protein
MSKPITGARLIEMGIAVLVSSVLSSALTATITVNVITERVAHLSESLDETREELRDLRRDIYRPAWPEESRMELSVSDLITDLKASLHSAARQFDGTQAEPDADYKRMIRAAAAAVAERRGRTKLGEITLEAGEYRYTTGVPADVLYLKAPLWGQGKRIMPWSADYPGPLPRARLVWEDGAPVILVTPSPTRDQIHTLGERYRFYYAASLWSGDDSDPIHVEDAADRELLLLRAQAEAMREMSLMQVAKVGETKIRLAQSNDMTPTALWKALMAEFDRRMGVAA